MRQILPHLHLADYCLWFIVMVVVVSAPLPFLTSEVVTINVVIAAATIFATALGTLGIVLFRGRRARRLSRGLSHVGAVSLIAFDGAQLQEDERPLRDFDEGCLSIEQGGARLWLARQKAGDGMPAFDIRASEIIDIRAERIFRFGCYPLLVITLSNSKELWIRPLKPSWPSWRIGMNQREIQATIEALTRTGRRRG